MAEFEIVEEHEETADEQRLREWFAEQRLAAPDTLNAAARLLIGLDTGLVGTLFGVLTVTAEAGEMPAYMGETYVRGLGVSSVVALLIALLAALGVVLPRKIYVTPARLDEQERALHDLLGTKSCWLRIATISFGIGVLTLGAILVIALLTGI